MNAQGRQQYSAPSFPPPPTEEYPNDQRQNMTTGLPHYAYRAMYDNYQYGDQYPHHPPKAGSHSNGSNRSQHSAHGSTRGRPEDERFGRRQLESGHVESERRMHVNDRQPRRRPTSSYDSDRSYGSRDTRPRHTDRRRSGMRSKSRRRSLEQDRRDQEVKKQQSEKQQQEQSEEKKTGLAKVEQYITPFNVGILMGCMDLIGGSISLYMTNKRFSKKALSKGPAPGEPGASSGGGDDSKGHQGGADKQQDRRSRSRARSRNRHRHSSRTGSRRNGGREGSVYEHRGPDSRRRGRDSREQMEYDDSDSDSADSSYWSRSDSRRYRHMPERLEYDNRGRPLSGPARATMRGAGRR